MHIEKNVYERIIGTLLNIPGKTKDGLNVRLNLVEMGLRFELSLRVDLSGPTFSLHVNHYPKMRKKIVFQTLSNLKVLEGYCSNFRNLVSLEELKFIWSIIP